ncbi:MAG: HAD-IIB family hydrolase [Halioglobus sp.]
MTATRLPMIVVSDLDGSLLDHYSYSFEHAWEEVSQLEQAGIPLVLASSKTREEILQLRFELNNRHPFIVENGAAVFIPVRYFPQQPEQTVRRDDYWVHEMTLPREHWLEQLAQLEHQFHGDFDSFNSAGVAGIMAMTGLSEVQASAANQREYSEPVRWLGKPAAEHLFISALEAAGATVQRGGRFLSVSGACDKGQALIWLRSRYQESSLTEAIEDLAIGDGANDAAMLDAATTALLVRSPVHSFPSLTKTHGVMRSSNFGPAGWAEGVAQWLRDNNIST